jgi:hypothetical protein
VPGDEHLKYIKSEPIGINKELIKTNFDLLSPVELTEQGKHDRTILEELRKFNEYANQNRQQFLDFSLNISTGMKDSILHACNAWNAL